MMEQPIPKMDFPNKDSENQFIEDELVSILEYFDGRILVEPVYYKQGLAGTSEDCKIRRTVAKKLETALLSLPENLTFQVFDGWRSVKTQKVLYDGYFKSVQQKHPHWSLSQLEEETRKFVSLPSLDENKPSVHNTGGALDLTLFDRERGAVLDMGTEFDDFSEKAHTCFFETAAGGEGSKTVRDNRRLLYWHMCSAGFTNLPTEWWHYDYGDNFWAFYLKKPAMFRGIVR